MASGSENMSMAEQAKRSPVGGRAKSAASTRRPKRGSAPKTKAPRSSQPTKAWVPSANDIF
jgi:hypothetical protein